MGFGLWGLGVGRCGANEFGTKPTSGSSLQPTSILSATHGQLGIHAQLAGVVEAHVRCKFGLGALQMKL